MEIRPVATIETPFREKFGIPRQSGLAGAPGRIVFEPEFRTAAALRELEGFSHLWLLFDFSLAHRAEWSPTVRPPRLGGNRRVGVFASRSPFRPNPIGLSSVRLCGVEEDPEKGPVLLVEGVDLLDGTPIFDIKPYLPFTDSHPNARGGYAEEQLGERLSVRDPQGLLNRLPERLRRLAEECLRQDPRPSYQEDPEREYGMRLEDWNIRFFVRESCAEIIEISQK